MTDTNDSARIGAGKVATGVDRPWADRKDKWSEAISAAHPVNSDLPWRFECFDKAMEMVGNRHGKYELVALVSWLLSDIESLRAAKATGQ